ncbi:hypothetical protein [Nitriliruptor alkaliphilus]|uniref:hypothetical protein n=1 Tax=Nitriliruptor alkaliphilus TaxID=427918 RepID=UPI000698073E|nr:hypothetical protein [Nitriliruptor alkaliphilus]
MGLVALTGCGDTTSPQPVAATDDDARRDDGPDPRADGPDGDARCAAAAEIDEANARLVDADDTFGGRTDPQDWSPDEIRDGADTVLAFVDAADRLGELVDAEQRAALAAWAAPHRQLAEIYVELDHDLANIDPDDADQMGRLSEAAAGMLAGPAWTDQQRDAFERLLDELAAACPELDIDRQPDTTDAPGQAEAPDPAAVVGDHTVSLSDAAVAAIDAEADITRRALAGEGSPPSPCPLWDPEAVASAVAGLLDDRIELSATVADRQGGEHWWVFACGSVDGRPDGDPGMRGPVSVAARSLDGPLSILDGATPQQAGGHDVFASVPADDTHQVFAVDLDHDLLLLVRAGPAPLADAVIAAVLDDLTAGS